MIKKIKLILHYGELDTTNENNKVLYQFQAMRGTLTMCEGSIFLNSSLEDLVKEVVTHIPNIDKL